MLALSHLILQQRSEAHFAPPERKPVLRSWHRVPGQGAAVLDAAFPQREGRRSHSDFQVTRGVSTYLAPPGQPRDSICPFSLDRGVCTLGNTAGSGLGEVGGRPRPQGALEGGGQVPLGIGSMTAPTRPLCGGAGTQVWLRGRLWCRRGAGMSSGAWHAEWPSSQEPSSLLCSRSQSRTLHAAFARAPPVGLQRTS